MLELNAANFVTASDELARVKSIIDSNFDDATKNSTVDQPLCERMMVDLRHLMESLLTIGAKIAWMAAEDLRVALADPQCAVTYAQISGAVTDVKSRLKHELSFVKMYVINGDRMNLLGGADVLLGQPTADRFKSLWFDCEEAAKCLVLGRPTASVFHAMRMLEIAIAALGKRLEIADPVKTAQRNWGEMLKQIKEAMDIKHPKAKRLAETEGAFLESVYVSLDAVKNPWRNATMHVDQIYIESEAFHILSCSATLVQKMSTGFDQDGSDVEEATPLLQ